MVAVEPAAREPVGALNKIPVGGDQARMIWCGECHAVFTNTRALEQHTQLDHNAVITDDSTVIMIKIRTLYWPAEVIHKDGELFTVRVFNKDKQGKPSNQNAQISRGAIQTLWLNSAFISNESRLKYLFGILSDVYKQISLNSVQTQFPSPHL